MEDGLQAASRKPQAASCKPQMSLRHLPALLDLSTPLPARPRAAGG